MSNKSSSSSHDLIAAAQKEDSSSHESGIAEGEGQFYAKLLQDAQKREHKRDQAVRDYAHSAIKLIITLAVFIFLAGLFTWSWHFLTPYNWHWLKPDRVKQIQEIMSGSLLGILVSDYARKYFMTK